jgi:hypothetical protein
MSGDVNFQGTNEEWTEFVKRINKEKKRLITEIMEDDAKDGLYHNVDTNKMVTAVEWLAEELKTKGHALITTKGVFINIPNELLKQAKEMEKAQRIKDYNAGYVDAQCNHINDAENYANEQEYINDREIKDYTIGPFGTPEKL